MTDTSEALPDVIITGQDALNYATSLLQAHGVHQSNANLIAQCLVAGDLRGIDTHGINRLPSYMARVRAGVLDAIATPEIKQVTPAVAQVDGRNGFGFLAAAAGIDKAVEMAQVFGIGMVSVKHSNHFGMSAWVVQRALESDMMSLVFTLSLIHI